MILVCVILAFLPVPLARVAGYEIYNILTGSMEPAIPVGSAILVRSADPAGLAPGDVIAYHRGGTVVAHRVVENDGMIQTKGDANQDVDPLPVRYSEVVGRVEHSIPVLGGVLGLLTDGVGRIYAIALALAGAVLRILGGQLRLRAERAAAAEKQASAQGAGADGAQGADAAQSASAEPGGNAGLQAADAGVTGSGVPERAQAGAGANGGNAGAAGMPDATRDAGGLEPGAAQNAGAAGMQAGAQGAARPNRSRRLRLALMIVLAAVFLLSAGVLIGLKLQEWQRQRFYDDAAQRFTAELPEEPEEDGPPITVDFAALQAVNPDIQGWIYCEDTPIDYPVLYSADNDTYLRHDYEKNYSNAGSIFVEEKNKPNFADHNTIIYGHNMQDGSMFAVLKEWADPEFAESHPEFWLLTPEQNYRVRIFSAHEANALDSSVYSIFTGPCEQMTEYLTRMAGLSDFTPHGQLPTDGKYLLLSTCTDAVRVDMERYVLHGLLEPVPGA